MECLCWNISWCPITTAACICGFSLSIKVITRTKTPNVNFLYAPYVCTHTLTLDSGRDFMTSTPTPHAHYYHAVPSPPARLCCVYMHAVGGGGVGKVPTQSLLNTFVSAAHRAENRTGKLLQANTLQQEKGVRRNAAQLFRMFSFSWRRKKSRGLGGGRGGGDEGCGHNWLSIDSESKLQWRQSAWRRSKVWDGGRLAQLQWPH